MRHRTTAAHRVHDIVQLVYVSRAVRELERFDLQQIIATSRLRNWRAGISGSLLSTGTQFAQVLEGRADAVQVLMGRIVRDERHTSVRVAFQAPILKRAFPDWTMSCIFDPQLGCDIDDMLGAPDISRAIIAKLVDRMAADAFLGTS